ncbi:MAG: hypothetical protein FWG89_08630 [Treponema sp.]|nr:hypothetical protein [Treponema sp.]
MKSGLSVFLRSVALFAILYQLRLIADDLADTTVFAASLYAAFGTAIFLAWFTLPSKDAAGRKKIGPLTAIPIIVLVPWAVRVFIALPRFLIPSGSTASTEAAELIFDSLLLNFDRNNFVTLLPFYWAAATTYFSIRSRIFLRGAVIADAVLLVAIFGIARISGIAMYRWPIVTLILLTGIVFSQALALLFSLPPETMLGKKEKTTAVIVLLALVFFGGLMFLKPAQERAAQRGGGLLEPRFFSFDFSQFLRLESEISMTDDLILIVRKDPYDHNILLRRSVLSGYNKRQGFFRIDEIDEKTHPQRLPSRTTELFPAGFKEARRVNQEYFLVNFDASAFIGMKQPEEIIPYENWDASSFRSAYAVESLVSDAIYPNLLQSVVKDGEFFWPESQDFGLTEREFSQYTAYGDDERLRNFAMEITEGADSYTQKVEMIYNWLKYGDYRYSLRPGIAPDGDQLAWFLFESKKGYCSYYAFAMALLLRSLGIPARVTAGFFIDPETAAFDYFPVRADMAHAWIEVPFPGYGWIEFDPTTEYLAEDEEFRFSSGVDPNLLERLMREILENRSRLRPKMGQDAENPFGDIRSLARQTAAVLKNILPALLLALIITVFVYIRCGHFLLSVIHHNKRKKAVCLWKHARRRLKLAGLGSPPPGGEHFGKGNSAVLSESEWALRADALVAGTYAMYLESAAARFAPQYNDFSSMQSTYHLFSKSYRKTVSPWRRLLAWTVPPLALAFQKPRAAKLIILLLLVLLFSTDGQAQNGIDDIIPGQTENGATADAHTESARTESADELYNSALDAEFAEYWERAINLYREGRTRYPRDPRFPVALGNLFYNRSLYSLAWDEYLTAEQLRPYDPYILHQLANTASYLNLDRVSVDYLERLLAIEPDNRDAISDLGWMYYKVHRLEDGERLLTNALDYFGDDAGLSMTLATIYSDMYRYEEGKQWYEKAIVQAGPARGFVSIAYYNLSILEYRFHKYDLSIEAANASLDSQYRASGLISRGELLLRRLDLESAQADFNAAREIDSSPLAKLNLSKSFLISGKLREALVYALDCLQDNNNSWMAYYGIDPVRYKRDIHEILSEVYSGLLSAERFILRQTVLEKISSVTRSISYRFYAAVHRKLFQKYSLAAGDAYGITSSGAPPLDRNIQYFNAFESYPRRAHAWLNRARTFEVVIIPEAEASYNLEEGILLKDNYLIARALNRLDPVWEKDLTAQCYREFALRGSRETRQAAAAELFALNRGALLQAGISLPADIRIHYNAGGNFRRGERVLRRSLERSGFTQTAGTRFTLHLTITADLSGNYTVSCELTDTEGERPPLRRIIPLPSLSRTDIAGFTGVLSSMVFRVE